MSHRALRIAALGMVSCLGQGAAVNAAAMRAGYDGFQATAFADPGGGGPQLGAPAPGVGAQVRGVVRLAALAAVAVAEVRPLLGDEPLPVLLCLAEPERPGPLNGPGALKSLTAAITRTCDGLCLDAAHSLIIQGGRCGFVRALRGAETMIHDEHGLSGEDYFFREAALAMTRAFEQTVPDHPLWHPAAHIGEVGAAVGGAIVVQAHQALVRGYAPGPAALCHQSDDGPARAAFLMRYANEESRDGQ